MGNRRRLMKKIKQHKEGIRSLPECESLRRSEAEHDRWLKIATDSGLRPSTEEGKKLVQFIHKEEQKIALECVEQIWHNMVHLPPLETKSYNLVCPYTTNDLNEPMKEFIKYQREWRTVKQLAVAIGASEKLVEEYIAELDKGKGYRNNSKQNNPNWCV